MLSFLFSFDFLKMAHRGAGRHSPCRSSFAISKTAKLLGTKKTWEFVSPRLSLFSGSSIAPW